MDIIDCLIKWLILIFLCFSCLAFSQEEMRLSLQDALNFALTNNIDVAIADAKIDLVETVLKKKKARRFPKLGLSGNTGYTKMVEEDKPWSFELGGNQYTVEPPTENEWNTNLSFSIMQEIYTAGEISGEIEEAIIRKRMAEIEQRLTIKDLIAKVIRAYWELKKAYLLVELEEEITKLKFKIVETAKERLRMDTIVSVEVKKAEEELKRAEYNLVYSKNKRDEKQEDLLILLGTDNKIIIPIDEPEIKPQMISLEQAIKEGLQLREELKRYSMEIEEKRSALKVAKSMLYPKLSLSARYNLQGSNNDYLESLKKTKASSWDINLILSLSLYNRTIKKEKEEKEKELAEAYKIERRQREKIVHQIKKAYYALSSAKERINMLSSDISLAEEEIRIAQLKYKLGEIDTNELISLQLKLKEAKYKEIEARIDYKIAYIELEMATGRLK